MKRELKRRKDERTCEWLDRICEYYGTHEVSKKEMREILREVSVHSYINGRMMQRRCMGECGAVGMNNPVKRKIKKEGKITFLFFGTYDNIRYICNVM